MSQVTGPASNSADPLDRALLHAKQVVGGVPDRRVPATGTAEDAIARLGAELPEHGAAPAEVIDRLAAAVEPGLMLSASGRFYGWVMGGTLPAAMGADWLVSAWDQNAGMRDSTPGVVAAEEIASRWLLELLRLPADAAVGLTTGATMANFTCLAAARTRVLERVGWDVAKDGLSGAPRVRVLVGDEWHSSVELALRYLGLGYPEVVAERRPGPARRRCPARRPRGHRRTDHRLPAGRQHPLRRLRPVRRGAWPPPTRSAPGCTSTGPSACGRS